MKKLFYLCAFILLFSSALLLSGCGEHEHGYDEKVTSPTCTEKGYTTYTCECGESYKAEETAATGHAFGEWVTMTAPTCTVDGAKKRDCARCNYTESAPIEATGHSYTETVVLPKCEEKGYTTHTCACGDTYNDTFVDAAGHDFGDWFNTTDPTCTVDGAKRRNCKNCEKFETGVATAPGHTYTHKVVAPKCEEKGYTTHTCACGDTYTDAFVDEAGHDFGDWFNTTDPTCTVDGAKRRNCKNCEKFETGVVTAPGHNHIPTVVPPTCDDEGYTEHKCACGDSYTDTPVGSTGHTYDQDVVDEKYLKSAANCKNPAIYYYSCACGKRGAETFKVGEPSEDHSVDSYGWCTICDAVLDTTPTSGLTYKISDDGTYAILIGASDYVQKNVSKVVIATTYQDLPVTTIGLGHPYVNPFEKYTNLTHVYVPEGVTKLSVGAFSDCKNLTTVILPDSLTYIGGSAFEDSKKLASIVIPDAVTEIYDYTFRNCAGLKSIDFGSGVKIINKEAFNHCTSLEALTIPDNITSLDVLAFSDCTSIKTLDIGSGLTFIGSNAFYGCSSLESLVLPYNVGQINPSAFHNCTSLKTVVLTNNIRTLENQVFMGCTSLENVTLGENIWQIYPGAFSNCPNIKYNEKDGLNYLGSEENPYLYLIGTASRDITSATIDSTCVLINSYAFLGCTLEDVFIPTSVTEIMSNAFSGCTLAGATFEKTSKWKYGLIDNISSSDLSDKSKAATCLTSTYTAKSWARY